MTLRVVVRPKAAADLEEIWLFSRNHWGVAQADTYTASLRTAFAHLAALPGSGTVFEHVRTGYRRLNIGSHAIFYRSSNSRIVRILHQRQNAKKVLR
jgi:toxin ParE1/3/4